MDSSELVARNVLEQEETSKFEEWTDEKHGLFLKSMESTFVNQLYRSIEMFGLQSHKTSSSRSKSLKQKQTSTRSSGQFKVLRDGFWSKVEFQKDEPEQDQMEECRVPLSNPWIQRYRYSKVHSNKRCSASGARKMPNTNWPSSSEECNDVNIEVTDQNFNDGAIEEEKAATIDQATTSNDQVVPDGNVIVQADFIVEDRVCEPPDN